MVGTIDEAIEKGKSSVMEPVFNAKTFPIRNRVFRTKLIFWRPNFVVVPGVDGELGIFPTTLPTDEN
ncbi:MAG: hypothetical protein CM15mP58_20160 [Burkholderiaceae bacterium]|nr:MAG: hypothetical protein CM15mP58_20160 [Burkholderiaceae bacterium]